MLTKEIEVINGSIDKYVIDSIDSCIYPVELLQNVVMKPSFIPKDMVEHDLIGAQVLELDATYSDILEEAKVFWLKSGEKSLGEKGNATVETAAPANEGLLKDLKVDLLPRLGPCPERGAEVAVFVHPTDRLLVAVARLETQPARREAVGDLDLADRAAGLGEMIADADRVEHPFR